MVVGPVATNCYVVWCEEEGEAIIVDPGWDAEKILEAVREEEVEVALALIRPEGFNKKEKGGKVTYATEIVYHKDKEKFKEVVNWLYWNKSLNINDIVRTIYWPIASRYYKKVAEVLEKLVRAIELASAKLVKAG